MRKRIWITCIFILAICLVLLLLKKPQYQEEHALEKEVAVTNQLPSDLERSTNVEKQQTPNVSNAGSASRPPNAATMTPEEQRTLELQLWQKPIEFYGKVVDEDSNAVPGASITFGWSETPTKEGELKAMTKSDAEGLFSLHDKRGPALDIWFGKEGYYSSHHGQMGFSYSHGNFSPDPKNPVIFILHRKGQGTELITSANGIRPDVWLRVPKDNTPVRVDFFQKQASPTGQLEISQSKPPFQIATNWSFRLSIPDGGLVENQDEFQFTAPESGYQPTIEYDFSKGETNWTTQVTKQFYIAFGEPRKYGWLRIESNLTQETIFLTYTINPTGSQNLQPAE